MDSTNLFKSLGPTKGKGQILKTEIYVIWYVDIAKPTPKPALHVYFSHFSWIAITTTITTTTTTATGFYFYHY